VTIGGAVAAALIGAALVFPNGGVDIDGGTSCTECGSWIVLLVGYHMEGDYPWWLPPASASVAVLLWLVAVAIFRAVRRRSLATADRHGVSG